LKAGFKQTEGHVATIIRAMMPLFELQTAHYKRRYQGGDFLPHCGFAIVNDDIIVDLFETMKSDFEGTASMILSQMHPLTFDILCSGLEIQVPQLIANYRRNLADYEDEMYDYGMDSDTFYDAPFCNMVIPPYEYEHDYDVDESLENVTDKPDAAARGDTKHLRNKGLILKPHRTDNGHGKGPCKHKTSRTHRRNELVY
jgi:hypothetical protein